jgi:DNA-binding protein HU-beta
VGVFAISFMPTWAWLEPRPTSKELDVNKTEMAKKLAKKIGVSQAKAGEAIDAVFSTEPGRGIIAVELDAGRDVSIAGFGKFETRRRRARLGRNPATGATIHIPATTVAAFKAAKGLKDRVAL